MLAQSLSFVLNGIEAAPVEVEVDLAGRTLPPKNTIVGLPDASVKESLERVCSAAMNCGFPFPTENALINLAPAEMRKEGPVYDLPIAVAVLRANGTIRSNAHKGLMFAGELALDGRLRPVRGVISMAMLAKEMGLRGVVVPTENAPEGAAVGGLEVYPADSLTSVVGHLNELQLIEPQPGVDAESLLTGTEALIDFAEVRGQETGKRALLLAAAGGHNVLMIGPAGTGKTMMAKALTGILPPLSREEALETTRVYSAAGLVPRGVSLMTRRPVRNPHHTASAIAVVGGGTVPRPGEVSLAHHGVLFLDETPEFPRAVLETLRQPLEDGHVTIARSHSSTRFPARFMLVAAMNPTPKGEFATDEAGVRQMEKYLSRISGPLVDRIDIHVEVPRIPYKQLTGGGNGTRSAAMREKVTAARRLSTARNGGPLRTNATLSGKELDKLAVLDEAGNRILKQAMTEMGLSARAYDKVRRIARTIADVEGLEGVKGEHVAEAVNYRLLDRKL